MNAKVSSLKSSKNPVNPTSLTTRFGPLSYTADNIYAFPQGILGFPDMTSFVLAPAPLASLQGYTVLQSLSDDSVGVLLACLSVFNDVIGPEDLADARKNIGISHDKVLAFGIISLRSPLASESGATINLRGPIIIDSVKREGWQYVFSSPAYEIRHPLESLHATLTA